MPPKTPVTEEQQQRRDRRVDHNSVSQVGRLTSDPELRYITPKDPNRDPVAYTEFRIAVSNGAKSNGEPNQPTYISVATYNKLAETVAEHLSKGHQVLVEGRLMRQEWEVKDKTTGEPLINPSTSNPAIRERMIIDTGRSGAIQFLSKPQIEQNQQIDAPVPDIDL